jgi:hypothetical protein
MKASKTASLPARYRWAVASRVLAALLGGYVLAAAFGAALARCLPLLAGVTPAQGVLVATLLSFVIHTVAALWVFCARSAWAAWAGLAAATLACAVVLPATGMWP